MFIWGLGNAPAYFSARLSQFSMWSITVHRWGSHLCSYEVWGTPLNIYQHGYNISLCDLSLFIGGAPIYVRMRSGESPRIHSNWILSLFISDLACSWGVNPITVHMTLVAYHCSYEVYDLAHILSWLRWIISLFIWGQSLLVSYHCSYEVYDLAHILSCLHWIL
jgi:hypothetical protein